MSDFEVASDIRKAKTLSTEFYTDEQYFERSKETIFNKCWQFVGLTDQLKRLTPFDLLPGILDVPLIISSKNNELKCFSNVCTHRGMLLIDESCEADLIRCRYHGRRYDLNGKFLSMPEFEDVENFPAETDNLKNINIEKVGDAIFCSIEPKDSINEFIAPNTHLFSTFGKKPLHLKDKKEYKIQAHWALYCENYLEGFHIPFVHNSLNTVVDYGTYKTDTFRYSSLQTGYDSNGSIAGEYLFVFPNMMFNFYPWGISVNIVKPIKKDETIIEFHTYVADDSLLETGAGADLHRVEMEDEAIVEAVQKGIRSPFYNHGRYSPTREQGTHHFHRLIAEFFVDQDQG